MPFTILFFLICSNIFGGIHAFVHSESASDEIGFTNWGGNIQFSTQNIVFPRTVEKVQKLVRNTVKLRVLGSGHSFNRIADSRLVLLSTRELNTIVNINSTLPSVTVEGGIRFLDLVENLDSAGFALSNLAALRTITVAGAIQTGTHGSGIDNPSLASQVRSLELVKADGELMQIGPEDPRLKAIAVGLGAFGVITKVELNTEPTYKLNQHIYTNMPLDNFFNNFDAIWKLSYSAQLINQFKTADAWDNVIINVRSDATTPPELGNELFGATRSSLTNNLPWYQGLIINNFGLETSAANHIQTEYFVKYRDAIPAIKAMLPFFLSDPNAAEYKSLLIGMLVRTIKGDDFWMSEFNRGETMVAIHFSWHNKWDILKRLLPPIEKQLLQFEAIPHWGKAFTMSPDDFLKHYRKREEWIKLVEEFDPTGKFRNEFMAKTVFCPPNGCLQSGEKVSYTDKLTELGLSAYANSKLDGPMKEATAGKKPGMIERVRSKLANKLSDQTTYDLVIRNDNQIWAFCAILIRVSIQREQEIIHYWNMKDVPSSSYSQFDHEFSLELTKVVPVKPGTTTSHGPIVIKGVRKTPIVSVVRAELCH